MLVDVLLSVIIENLLPWLDSALGHDEHATLSYFRLCVRTARVVDVPCLVPLWSTINRLVLGDFEEVLAAARELLFLADMTPNVLNNARALGDQGLGKKTDPRARAAWG